MGDNTDQLNELLSRLNSLTRKQEDFAEEINRLREEMLKVTSASKLSGTAQQATDTLEETENIQEKTTVPVITPKPVRFNQTTYQLNNQQETNQKEKGNDRNKINRNIEKIIGENLISKIGIAILVLGVAIGTKYAIEHELISPLTRIILGYLVGLGLLGFAMKLKKKYDNFSAVLLSGAMAILYFITFAA